MSLVLKSGAASAIVTVGCAGTYFMVAGSKYMPNYSTVSSESEKTYTESTAVGKGYKHLLVDPYDEGNKDWWEWSHKRWKAKAGERNSNLSEEFKKGSNESEHKVRMAFAAKSGTGANDAKALNRVCDEAYKKKVTDDVDFSAGTDNKHKLAKDLLRFCSPLDEKPVSVKENEYGSNKIGATNKNDLASATDRKNGRFWELMEGKFKTLEPKPSDAFFGQFFKEEGGSKVLTQSLRDICHRAYGSEAESSTSTKEKPKVDDVKKYCAFGKMASS